MPRETPDHYARRAKKEGYVARSVYKLQEIDAKTQVIARGDNVLDLGAAPGSWTQYALEKAGSSGFVCAVDLSEIEIRNHQPRLKVLRYDIFSEELDTALYELPQFDVVLSDAAPATSGNRAVDTARSAALAERAIDLALRFGRRGTNIVVKLFQGGDEQQILASCRQQFRKARMVKPRACRKDSFEVYLVGNDLQHD